MAVQLPHGKWQFRGRRGGPWWSIVNGVHVQRRCGLSSNYFNHLLLFYYAVLWWSCSFARRPWVVTSAINMQCVGCANRFSRENSDVKLAVFLLYFLQRGRRFQITRAAVTAEEFDWSEFPMSGLTSDEWIERSMKCDILWPFLCTTSVAVCRLKDDMQRFFTKLMQKSFLAPYCNINPSV